jgi:putative transposon-encoded protein
LHDTVEDTNTTPEEIEKEFNKRVRDLVMECTDNKALGKVERKTYQIAKAEHASNGAKIIKIGDKISNNRGLLLETPVGWTPERVRGYFIWSQLVCQKLRGVNEILDKEIEAIFNKSGINNLSNEEK